MKITYIIQILLTYMDSDVARLEIADSLKESLIAHGFTLEKILQTIKIYPEISALSHM